MKHKRKLIVGLLGASLLFSVIVKYEDLIVLGKDKEQLQSASTVEIDYANVDWAVAEALKEEPEMLSKIKAIQQSNKSVENGSVKDLFDDQKTKFRLKVEDKLMNGNISDRELQKFAESNNAHYLMALDIAEKKYGVIVTQEEVTKYIEDNISIVKNVDKEQYAKALGLTVEELDYIFDRDLYLMDTLWGKIIPILMETYPQKDGEDQIPHIDRIKEEFYAN